MLTTAIPLPPEGTVTLVSPAPLSTLNHWVLASTLTVTEPLPPLGMVAMPCSFAT